MTIQYIGTKTLKLTQALASRHMALPALEHDRPISPRRIAYLREQIVNRHIVMPFNWITASVDGRLLRLNGAHSSSLLCNLSPTEFPMDGIVLLSHWECDSCGAATALYAQIDPRQSARSCGDIYRVAQAANPALADVPQRTFAACASGIAIWIGKSRAAAIVQFTPFERASLALQNESFCVWVGESIVGREIQVMVRRAPVVAAMFGTWSKCQADTRTFWAEVIEGSNPKVNAPSRVLQKYLLSTSVNLGQGSLPGRRTDSGDRMVIRCIRAWNAYRDHSTTDLKVYSKTFPVVK